MIILAVSFGEWHVKSIIRNSMIDYNPHATKTC